MGVQTQMDEMKMSTAKEELKPFYESPITPSTRGWIRCGKRDVHIFELFTYVLAILLALSLILAVVLATQTTHSDYYFTLTDTFDELEPYLVRDAFYNQRHGSVHVTYSYTPVMPFCEVVYGDSRQGVESMVIMVRKKSSRALLMPCDMSLPSMLLKNGTLLHR